MAEVETVESKKLQALFDEARKCAPGEEDAVFYIKGNDGHVLIFSEREHAEEILKVMYGCSDEFPAILHGSSVFHPVDLDPLLIEGEAKAVMDCAGGHFKKDDVNRFSFLRDSKGRLVWYTVHQELGDEAIKLFLEHPTISKVFQGYEGSP